MIVRYNLPAVTATMLNDYVNQCKNLSLIMDKYPTQTVITETKNKGPWLQGLTQGNHIDLALTRAAYSRWYAMMSAMKATLFNASVDWRMVVGLGGETVLETDLTLHHLYGIPYIPGSALKGLTRAYVTGELEGYKSEKLDNDNEEVKRIFGSQERAGTVIFFDAMPVDGRATFALDIMNSHYPKYYGEKALPTNDQDPNPVTFLTVTNTTFMFALASRNPQDQQHLEDVEQAQEWLKTALEKYGVGGKTSAGYGYFKEIHDGQESASVAQSSQATSTPTSSPAQLAPGERIRPNIPKFRERQEITGSVVAPTDELRQRISSDAKAFLRYQSFSTKDVLIVVNAEEAQNWKPGETRICLFIREEVQNGCTVLVCQPRPSKKKKG